MSTSLLLQHTFELLDRGLVCAGADPIDTTLGVKINNVKARLPSSLVDDIFSFITLRNRAVHEYVAINEYEIAPLCKRAVDGLMKYCEEKGLGIPQSSPFPAGRVNILDFLLPLSPLKRSAYLHIRNDSTESFDISEVAISAIDFGAFHKLAHVSLTDRKGTFDPGEHLLLIFKEGSSGFRKRDEETDFPEPHWDIYCAIDMQPFVMATRILFQMHVGARLLATLTVTKTRAM